MFVDHFPEANRLTIHILAAVAEHEAAMISQRTKAALAAAKARTGAKPLGGDRGSRLKIATQASKGAKVSAAVRGAAAAKRAKDLVPVIQTMKSEGTGSLRQIAAKLNELGIATSRGGQWSAVQVSRVLGLYELSRR